MKLNSFLKRLTSRKFLMALAGFLMGLFTLLKIDQSTSVQVVGLIVSGISIAGYLIAETTLDHANIMNEYDSANYAEEEPTDENKIGF